MDTVGEDGVVGESVLRLIPLMSDVDDDDDDDKDDSKSLTSTAFIKLD